MSKFWTFLLVIIFYSTNIQAQCTAVMESDSLALVDFYYAIGGDLLEQNGGWLEDPISEWVGITLSEDGCSVIEINLSNQNLTGFIPDLNLPSLQNLNLTNNELSGSIPDLNLPSLEICNLSGNELSDEIPNFTNLLSLLTLGLNYNQLSGSIPDLNLPSLEICNLSNNKLNGVIPNFSHLSNLKSIDVSFNELSGTIPNIINLTNLITLGLSYNQLSGEIPNFSDLPNLKNLYLNNNELIGAIPDFSSLLNLYDISANNNQLSGSIPDFSNLSELTIIILNNNQLSGSIPDFSSLPDLIELNLANNQLSGSIPNFSNLSILQYLILCPNNLTGNIPSFIDCPLLDVSEIDFSCVIAAKTTGTTYADLNGNCIKEANEPTIPNAIIATTDYTSYAFSNENGFYTLKTDTGIHSFNAFVPNYLWEQTCLDFPDAYTINPQTYEDSLSGFDFGFQPLVECPLMLVEVGTPLLRRCFTNTYTVNYCNAGTAAAENAEIHLSLGEAIIPLESSISYEEQDENYLVFNVGTVGIGECGSFTLTDSLSCDAVLGSTACVEAFAFPNDLCFEDTSLWDGSDLKISAACSGNEVTFDIVNRGDDMEEESEYRMYEEDVVTITSTLFLMAGEHFSFTRNATGQAFRLTADQTPNHPTSTFVTEVVELCGADNDMASLGFINTQSNVNYNHFYDINCQEIIGSYDPNDKTVTPKGIGDEHRITASQDLEYKIRFQNIGNDTAFRVVVIDTIDTDFLNINSLKLGVSSHDYTAEIKEGKVLIFTFENILLVDSTTNEAASHGFLMFKISQKAGNQRDDLIQNESAIYFDYNQPVITNKAFNIIGLPLDEGGKGGEIEQIEAAYYFDNAYFNIELKELENNTDYSLLLYHVGGQAAKPTQSLSWSKQKIWMGDLPLGVYVFEIQATNGKKKIGKFMVQ